MDRMLSLIFVVISHFSSSASWASNFCNSAYVFQSWSSQLLWP